MSFERPLGANARADQTTVRRANLGVVLKDSKDVDWQRVRN